MDIMNWPLDILVFSLEIRILDEEYGNNNR
jgi:hypothetical protein